jgi:hypothetical protein
MVPVSSGLSRKNKRECVCIETIENTISITIPDANTLKNVRSNRKSEIQNGGSPNRNYL